jgi:hypothetical protein
MTWVFSFMSITSFRTEVVGGPALTPHRSAAPPAAGFFHSRRQIVYSFRPPLSRAP